MKVVTDQVSFAVDVLRRPESADGGRDQFVVAEQALCGC
jgi:hypothetical protein